MVNKISLKIVGLKPVLNTMKVLSAPQRTIAEWMAETLRHAAARSRLNAPILDGWLRRSIKGYVGTKDVENANLKFPANMKTVTGKLVAGSSKAPYAYRWHENQFELGDVSAEQPPTVEGGIGPKYITRIFNHHNAKYQKDLRKKFQQHMQAASKGSKKGSKLK